MGLPIILGNSVTIFRFQVYTIESLEVHKVIVKKNKYTFLSLQIRQKEKLKSIVQLCDPVATIVLILRTCIYLYI